MATQATDSPVQRRYDRVDAVMLATILVTLAAVFLGGMGIIVAGTNTAGTFTAESIVAIISPALAAVGTVAAGVFGYALGTRGSGEAQTAAHEVAREAAAARQQTAATAGAAGSLASAVQRIHDQAMAGKPTTSGKREVSEDDLKTIASAARQVTAAVPNV